MRWKNGRNAVIFDGFLSQTQQLDNPFQSPTETVTANSETLPEYVDDFRARSTEKDDIV